jgi:DNA-binding transcriptional MocR family regulator
MFSYTFKAVHTLFCIPDFQEPYAVVVLLEKDLVLIDLAQNG